MIDIPGNAVALGCVSVSRYRYQMKSMMTQSLLVIRQVTKWFQSRIVTLELTPLLAHQSVHASCVILVEALVSCFSPWFQSSSALSAELGSVIAQFILSIANIVCIEGSMCRC